MENRMRLLSRGMSAAVLAITLLVMGCSATAPSPFVSTPAASSSPRGGLPTEGIEVHGHWTIEVRNADGTVAEVREFENALTSDGARVISRFLGRANSVGGWRIILTGNTALSGAFESTGGTKRGVIMESGGFIPPDGPAGYFPNLTVATPVTGINDGKLVLSGTATAQFDGNIGTVATRVDLLLNTEAPSPSWGLGTSFTDTTLAAPINLLAGQQVLVTVVISFS